MINDNDKDQQLLEGVALINSIQCSSEAIFNEQSEVIRNEEELFSFHIDNQSFEISSNQTEFQRKNIFEQDQLHQQAKMSSSNRQKNMMKSTKKSFPNKNINFKQKKGLKEKSAQKTWNNLLELDDQLFKVHYTGAIDCCLSSTQKIRKIILTRQFCKFKILQKQLEKTMDKFNLLLQQQQKQKRLFLKQITQLKKDNEGLINLTEDLYEIIKNIQSKTKANQREPRQKLSSLLYSNSFQEKYISGNINNISEVKNDSSSKVPFSNTFSHSIEEINLNKIVEEEKKRLPTLPIHIFIQYILHINRKIRNIESGQEIQSISLDYLNKLFENKKIKDVALETQIQINRLTSIRQNENSKMSEMKKSSVEFNQLLLQNKHVFSSSIADVKSNPEKFYQYSHILHTSLLTFFGALLSTKMKFLTNSLKLQQNELYHQLQNLLQLFAQLSQSSQVVIPEESIPYFKNLQSLIKNFSDILSIP